MSAWESHRERPLRMPLDATPGRDDPRVAALQAALVARDEARMSDRDQARARAIHAELLGRIEDGLRDRIAPRIDRTRLPMLAAALETRRVRLTGELLQSGAAIAPTLVDAILVRLDEDRLARRAAAFRDHQLPPADPLAGDDDPATSAAIGTLIRAEGRRRDAFGEPIVDAGDLDPATWTDLVWTVAAALRRYMRVQHQMSAAEADGLLDDAATDLLAAPRETGAEDAALALVAGLQARGALDDRLVADSLAAGRIPLFVIALARCARVPVGLCRAILGTPTSHRLAWLLYAADLSREAAMRVLLILADDPLPLAAQYEAINLADVAETLRLWRLDPAYRAALAAAGEIGEL